MDPASLVMSFDLREAIGVRYGRGAPSMRYFDESHPHDAAGKTYELYAPHNETHGFFNDATAREYYERVFAFLARHLPVTAASGAQGADTAEQAGHIADGSTPP